MRRQNHRENVSMVGSAVSARSAEEAASASTDEDAVSARSAEEPASVCTDEDAVIARSVEEAVSVSMVGSAVSVKNAKVCAQISNAAYDQHMPCLLQVKLLLPAKLLTEILLALKG